MFLFAALATGGAALPTSSREQAEKAWPESAAISAAARMMRAEARGEVLLESGRQAAAYSVDAQGKTGLQEGIDVDCEWGDWADWSVCQFTCGEGIAVRVRAVKQMAQGSGKACDNSHREERDCKKTICPVDCEWEDWTDWTECSKSCGEAQRFAQRGSRAAEFGGRLCAGSSQRAEDCNLDDCPVDCQWTDWSDWHGCSKTCGGGKESRSRESTPGNSQGKPCVGEALNTRTCAENMCPTDCVVGDWLAWEPCSVSCGSGTAERKRSIKQQPAYGGEECPASVESQPCSPEEICPVDCVWSEWSEWQACSATCGHATSKHSRTVIVEANELGKACTGEAEEEITCSYSECPIDCVLAEWSDWSDCSVSCGPGIMERSRTLDTTAQHGGKDCGVQDLLYEKKYCSLPTCPVDCEWVDWLDWSACSASCGDGHSSRTRMVKTEKMYGGKDCSGETEQDRDCDDVPCPVDCVWNSWSSWTPCSQSCGGGVIHRSRDVAEPGHDGGAGCTGDADEEAPCEAVSCPVDCVVADWSDWSPCSTTCGGGVIARSRNVQVETAFGGLQCPQNLTEYLECAVVPCPVDCTLGDWRDWSACSTSCGQGQRVRTRLHATESFGGLPCHEALDEEACGGEIDCPHDCVVGDWLDWEPCSVSCGNGTTQRTRSVQPPAYGGAQCPASEDTKSCSPAICAVDCVWSEWSEWEACSATCGQGTSRHSRTVLVAANELGKPCSGDAAEEVTCSFPDCPVDCILAEWSSWSECSVSCGQGLMERSRAVNRAAEHGGADCASQDLLYDQKLCSLSTCPIDCEWSDWLDWGTCSVSCGDGHSSRTRMVKAEKMYGGKDCAGETLQNRDCGGAPCPVDCVWNSWSSWTPCSQSCGGGVIRRFRDVVEPGHDGGSSCLGDAAQEAPCEAHACPVNCVITEWSDWSACSVTCDGGVTVRFRVVQVEAAFGGLQCPPNPTESHECSADPCPIDCTLGDWRDWSTCSTSCGHGQRVRTRLRENERFGGLPCDEALVQEEECYVAPLRPQCPDLPTTHTTTSRRYGVATMTAPPSIPPEVAKEASKLAKQGDVEGLKRYLKQAEATRPAAAAGADYDPMHFRGAQESPESPNELNHTFEGGPKDPWRKDPETTDKNPEPCTKEELQATVDQYGQVGGDRQMDQIIAKLKEVQDQSPGGSLPDAVKLDQALQGGKEVLRIEGDLYVYAAHADSFIADPKVQESFELLIAGKAQVDTRNVEVLLSIPQRIVEAEWQKKAKGNILCKYTIHVMSKTGSAADGDAVIKKLSDVDEVEAKEKIQAIFKEHGISQEVTPVSMTMKPYRL